MVSSLANLNIFSELSSPLPDPPSYAIKGYDPQRVWSSTILVIFLTKYFFVVNKLTLATVCIKNVKLRFSTVHYNPVVVGWGFYTWIMMALRILVPS